MPYSTYSFTSLKQSKAELVIDRKVVDQIILNAENPVAIFTAEYINPAAVSKNGESVASAMAKARQENSLRFARMLLTEFIRVVSEIDETDPLAVDAMLTELSQAFTVLTEGDPAE